MKKVLVDAIEIGECSTRDNTEVSEFFKDIYNELGWEISPSEGLDNPKEFFHEQKGWLLVAKIDRKIVGISGIVPLSDGNGVLKRFFIHQNYRGAGISEKLLQSSNELVQKKYLKELFVEVRAKNVNGGRFWDERVVDFFTPKQSDEKDAKFGCRVGSGIIALVLLLCAFISDNPTRKILFIGLAVVVFIAGMIACALLDRSSEYTG